VLLIRCRPRSHVGSQTNLRYKAAKDGSDREEFFSDVGPSSRRRYRLRRSGARAKPIFGTTNADFDMASNSSAKFVRPDADARQAQVAKTARLRSLRLAKEAEDAEKAAAEKLAAAAAKPRSRARASQRPSTAETA
jgi:hypothetical protein